MSFPFNFRPPHLERDFIFPTAADITEKNINITPETIVRIAASFDMGWTTRGTGGNYDSLTGSAAFMGFLTEKILAHISKNRNCRMCHLGHSPTHHDCRRNFEGTAKAMEPKTAADLVLNAIFKQCFVQWGFMIADNDSSSIAAMRAVVDHEIIKHADKNHTSKDVANELCKFNRAHKELNADSIKFLQRCFSFSVSQNVGDAKGMAKAIKNVPYHCFNQ